MNWKSLVGTIAPVLGAALGGPLGGIALKALADALGLSESTEEAISTALSGAKPEDLLKLKLADQQFAKDMKALDVDLERIASSDRDSARQREAAVKDRIPGTLAVGITAGFFGVLAYMMINGAPATGGEALLVMLGSLGTSFAGVISYYYGSTSSSKVKDATIKNMTER